MNIMLFFPKLRDQMYIIYVTYPTLEIAEKAAEILLSEYLIKCANILPEIKSLYLSDNNNIIKTAEVIAIFKCALVPTREVFDKIEAVHPYDIPCIISLKADDCNKSFLEWLNYYPAAKINNDCYS